MKMSQFCFCRLYGEELLLIFDTKADSEIVQKCSQFKASGKRAAPAASARSEVGVGKFRC